MDRSFKQKIKKETIALNGTLDQMDLADIFRTCHPKAAEYTFFSSAYGTFSRTDHIVAYKTSLNKFKKIIPHISSNHKAMKLEVNYKKKIGKSTNIWRLKNMLLNNECINQKVKEEIKRN